MRRQSKRRGKSPPRTTVATDGDGGLKITLSLAGKPTLQSDKREVHAWAVAAHEALCSTGDGLYAEIVRPPPGFGDDDGAGADASDAADGVGDMSSTASPGPPRPPDRYDAKQFYAGAGDSRTPFPGHEQGRLLHQIADATDTARSVKTTSFVAVDGDAEGTERHAQETTPQSQPRRRKSSRKSQRGRKLTKDAIGSPMDFRHVEHAASPQEAMHAADLAAADWNNGGEVVGEHDGALLHSAMQHPLTAPVAPADAVGLPPLGWDATATGAWEPVHVGTSPPHVDSFGFGPTPEWDAAAASHSVASLAHEDEAAYAATNTGIYAGMPSGGHGNVRHGLVGSDHAAFATVAPPPVPLRPPSGPHREPFALTTTTTATTTATGASVASRGDIVYDKLAAVDLCTPTLPDGGTSGNTAPTPVYAVVDRSRHMNTTSPGALSAAPPPALPQRRNRRPWLVEGASREQLRRLTSTFAEKSPVGNFFVRDGVQSVQGGLGLTVKVPDDMGGVKKFLIVPWDNGFAVRGIRALFKSIDDVVAALSSEVYPVVGVRLAFHGLPPLHHDGASAGRSQQPAGSEASPQPRKPLKSALKKHNSATPTDHSENNGGSGSGSGGEASARGERVLDALASRVADKLVAKQREQQQQQQHHPHVRAIDVGVRSGRVALGHGGPTPAEAAAAALRLHVSKGKR